MRRSGCFGEVCVSLGFGLGGDALQAFEAVGSQSGGACSKQRMALGHGLGDPPGRKLLFGFHGHTHCPMWVGCGLGCWRSRQQHVFLQTLIVL